MSHSAPFATTASGPSSSAAPPAWARPSPSSCRTRAPTPSVMDFAEVKLPGAKAIHVNLGDKASIDAALAECSGPVDALFSCAGVADGTPNIEKINFIGHRYMIDKLARPRRPRPRQRDRLHLVGRGPRLGGEPPAAEGVPRHLRLRRRGAVGAGPHEGRLHVEQAGDLRVRRAGGDGASSSRASASTRSAPARPTLRSRRPTRTCGSASAPTTAPRSGVEAATPLEQAYPLVFLCSDAAGAITGQTIITDSGYFAAGVTETFPDATPAVNFLLGRY